MSDARDRILEMAEELSPAEIADLIRDLETARQRRLDQMRAEILREVEERAASIGMSARELVLGFEEQPKGPAPPKGKAQRAREVADIPDDGVMFRDRESGGTWSGRGRVPKWLKEAERQGRSREEFRIALAVPSGPLSRSRGAG